MIRSFGGLIDEGFKVAFCEIVDVVHRSFKPELRIIQGIEYFDKCIGRTVVDGLKLNISESQLNSISFHEKKWWIANISQTEG